MKHLKVSKVGRVWVVYYGKRILGAHKTRAGADRQMRAIWATKAG